MTSSTKGIARSRRRLVLEAPVLTPDQAGGAAESFITVAAVWAEVRWLSGDERWSAGRTEQAARYEITIRWRAGVNAGMRLTGPGVVFGILSAGDPTGNRSRLVCLCEVVSP